MNDKPFWRCMIPGCTHVLYQQSLLIGRDHICWLCETPMVIDKDSAAQMKPVCSDCKEERKEYKQKMGQVR